MALQNVIVFLQEEGEFVDFGTEFITVITR